MTLKNTVVVAQLVRALVCGAGGRGFEPHHPPRVYKAHFARFEPFFVNFPRKLDSAFGSNLVNLIISC